MRWYRREKYISWKRITTFGRLATLVVEVWSGTCVSRPNPSLPSPLTLLAHTYAPPHPLIIPLFSDSHRTNMFSEFGSKTYCQCCHGVIALDPSNSCHRQCFGLIVHRRLTWSGPQVPSGAQRPWGRGGSRYFERYHNVSRSQGSNKLISRKYKDSTPIPN